MVNNWSFRSILLVGVFFLASCQHEKSRITGWNYNDPQNGGFEKVPYVEQETGPGLILVQGGTFVMGRVEQDVNYDWNNVPQRKTVSSFYMDETEITNFHWLEYIYWLRRVYAPDYPEIVKKALPDTLVWREKLAYNEPYVDYYFRHPAYRDYPVVGVNWLQANDFCKWRTDRVNEYILIREGLFYHNPAQINEDHFTTKAYYANQYESGKAVEGKRDLNPNKEYRNVRMEDGILLPRYRLPTEAEWEFAAYALVGNTFNERIVQKRLYPWDGHWVRNPEDEFIGDFQANFVRGRGDYMGVAWNLNDNADVTAPVYSYWPNDYGLYNMAGNVSEWVMDVYRPLTNETSNEFRPFRGNVYKTKERNNRGGVKFKRNIVNYDLEGMKEFLTDFQEKIQQEGTASQAELDLMSQLLSSVDQAIEKKNNNQETEANQQVQDDVVLKIKDQQEDMDIAPVLLKDIAEYIDGDPGTIRMREVTEEENIDRRNYRHADNIDHLDGDKQSSIYYSGEAGKPAERVSPTGGENSKDNLMYDWGATTLVSDKARVYKGGSWKDRAYWMSPGTRRYLNEKQSKAYIGFRCAMTRVGSPVGLYGKD